jgi:ABC-type branched-subunit amino acid transport system substrate-binding protein
MKLLPTGIAAVVGAAAVACAFAAPLTREEESGKKIFLEGSSPSGATISAMVGVQSIPVPGSTVPCGNCHGADGLGRPEGAVQPSIITWRELTKPYGHVHDNGRKHAAFTEKTVADALTRGVDPAGNRLDPVMPRYTLSQRDLFALVAYLKRMETELDPGLSEKRIRLGTLLPTQGRTADLGKAVREAMQAYFDAVNATGGIYGRHVELVNAEYSDDGELTLANAERMIKQGDVFALVSPFTMRVEKGMTALSERERIPLVGPFTLFPESNHALNRYTFYLLPGLREQARVLAEFAAKDLKLHDPETAVVYPKEEKFVEIGRAVEDQLAGLGWTRLRRVQYPRGELPAKQLVALLQQNGVAAVFFLGNEAEFADFTRGVREATWAPYVFAPGSLAARSALEVAPSFANRLFLAFPTLAEDLSAQGAQAIAEMRKKYQGPGRNQQVQIAAYASAMVLAEGLRLAGKDVSRARLMTALEGLHGFQSGLTPPIGYGPGRRMGALGAHVVGVDLQGGRFRPTGKYVQLGD